MKSKATKIPRESTPYIKLTLHFSQHDQEFFCLLQYFAWHYAGCLASRPSLLSLLFGNYLSLSFFCLDGGLGVEVIMYTLGLP